ncbi:hypothetical protein KY385_00270 [Candidatus Parcubacteria bacterium]|nr:hypothetical protein [Candidatus Parcubacteria bacterium]
MGGGVQSIQSEETQISFEYQHGSGETFKVDSVEEAHAACPFLGKLSLEEAEMMLEMQALGKQEQEDLQQKQNEAEMSARDREKDQDFSKSLSDILAKNTISEETTSQENRRIEWARQEHEMAEARRKLIDDILQEQSASPEPKAKEKPSPKKEKAVADNKARADKNPKQVKITPDAEKRVKPKIKTAPDQTAETQDTPAKKPLKNSSDAEGARRPLKLEEAKRQPARPDLSGDESIAAADPTAETVEAPGRREFAALEQPGIAQDNVWAEDAELSEHSEPDELEYIEPERALAAEFAEEDYRPADQTPAPDGEILTAAYEEAVHEIYEDDRLSIVNEKLVADEIDHSQDSQISSQPEQADYAEIDENIVTFSEQTQLALQTAEPEIIERAEHLIDQIESIILEPAPGAADLSESIEAENIKPAEDDEEIIKDEVAALVTELSDTLKLDYSKEEIAEIAASLIEFKQKLQDRPQIANLLPEEKGTREFKLSRISSQLGQIKNRVARIHPLLGFIALAKRFDLQLKLEI